MNMIERLLALQDIDIQIRDITKELADIPKRKALEEARLDAHKAAMKSAEDSFKAKQAEVKKQELEVAACKDKILKLRQQQMTLKTNKEFKAIDSEIATVEAAIAGFEDRELILMADMESFSANVRTQKEALEREGSDVRKDVEVWVGRSNELEAAAARLRAQRTELAAAITDRVWLARYEQVMSRRDRALVRVEDGVCGGCHLKCPPYIIHGAKKHTEMVSCNDCGRILY